MAVTLNAFSNGPVGFVDCLRPHLRTCRKLEAEKTLRPADQTNQLKQSGKEKKLPQPPFTIDNPHRGSSDWSGHTYFSTRPHREATTNQTFATTSTAGLDNERWFLLVSFLACAQFRLQCFLHFRKQTFVISKNRPARRYYHDARQTWIFECFKDLRLRIE